MFTNTFKTFTLLAGLAGLAVAVGGLLGGSTGLLLGLLLGLAIVGFSYWQSDKLALRAARARVVTAAEAPELHRMVSGLAQRADLPMPTVAISPSLQPNAFATGRNPHHAVVCVTEGLWQTMPRDEIEGVLAHELMHVRHRDILIGSVAAAIATGISFLAQMAMFSAIFGGRDDDERRQRLRCAAGRPAGPDRRRADADGRQPVAASSTPTAGLPSSSAPANRWPGR